MKLTNYPLLKILFPFVLGILLGYFCHFPFPMCRIWFFITLGIWLLSCFLSLIRTYKWQWLKTFTLATAFFFAGLSAINFQFSSHLSPEQTQSVMQNRNWMVRVVDFPVQRTKTVKLVAEIVRTAAGEPVNDRVMFYVQRTPETETINYGDLLLLHSQLSEFAPPENPDAFDNQRYMQRKGIYHTGYVRSGFWQKAGYSPPNPLKALAHRIQQHFSGIFADAGMSGHEYEIVKAILLGDDDTMEPELKAAYAAAGVSHILCVSGMHVGVIFLILNFLLHPLDLFKGTRVIKALVLLLVIWLYAHITGLSPSVTRSATMFTFVTVGQLIQRNTNVFHSILASLWILLTFNPLLLFELGFQLSYLAVVSIVLLQPVVASIYTCKTKIGSYFWGLITVSVAAQIGTFPISAHYFGQFPNYFLLSNLSVITLSFVVMMTGVTLLSVSFVPFLCNAFSFLLTGEIRIMNGIITFIEGLPGATTQNIDFSTVQVWTLYAVISFTFLAVRNKSRLLGWVAFVSLALFSSTFLLRKVEVLQQDEAVVYSIRNTCAIAFCHQQQGIFLSDSILCDTGKMYQYAAANHMRRQHADYDFLSADTLAFDNGFLCKRGPLIRFNHQTFYLLKRMEKVHPTLEHIPVDVLILQYNPTQLPDEVAKVFHFRMVVADATNTPFYVRRWEDWCRERGILFRKGGRLETVL